MKSLGRIRQLSILKGEISAVGYDASVNTISQKTKMDSLVS